MALGDLSPEIDNVDQSIITCLQHDGRRSYASIGRDIGLSEAAVRARVNRLAESGVMQIVAVTDPIRAGLRRQAMIGIRVEGDLEAVAEAVALIDQVIYVVIAAGSYDVLVELVVADDAELLAVLNQQIRTVPGVARTDTLPYLRLVKQTYTWGSL